MCEGSWFPVFTVIADLENGVRLIANRILSIADKKVLANEILGIADKSFFERKGEKGGQTIGEVHGHMWLLSLLI